MPTVTEELVDFFSKVLPFAGKTVLLDIRIDFCNVDDALYHRLLDESLGNLTTSIETVIWHVPYYEDSAGALLLMIGNLSKLRVLRMHLPVAVPITIPHRGSPISFPDLQDIQFTVSASCGPGIFHYMNSYWDLPSFRSFGLFGDASTTDFGIILPQKCAKIVELDLRCKSSNVYSMMAVCQSLEVLSVDFGMLDITCLCHPNLRSLVVHNFGLNDIASTESRGRMHSFMKTCISRINLPALVEITFCELVWWQVRQLHSQWLSDAQVMCKELRLLDKNRMHGL